ncbi:ABC transporter ATP-binding protein [Rhodothermus marinus]|uniref:ABC transporter related protein n=1 Tax=Rhodothermus marinus (strain ATCC 43812 / DSM 4252 / R-10) TaxID=518766 RepID=D0MEX0_RHOM4|nr:ABC transporter ATP-binding protein [Rhodothermus marinus]ACY47420.1 ABC transporter related protein [Rhodothermus marinus DSM 4252]
MSTIALEVQGCSRRFRSRKGTVQALQDVTFQVPEGACCGLLGPNGAGKSTLIRILANVLKPDAGRISVLGEPLRWGKHAYKQQVGFMLEDLALMERLTGREQLELAARLYGLSPEQATATIEALVAPFEVATALDRWIETYSHGMRRQLAFLLALLHRPRLLVLDEPFEAMDAQALEAAITLLHAHHRQGATLLISSHRLDKLERLCDHLVVLHRGRVRFAGSLADFRDHLPAAESLETAYLHWLREG